MNTNKQAGRNLLVCALYLSDSPRDLVWLAEISGFGLPGLQNTIFALEKDGLLCRCAESGGWRCLAAAAVVKEKALILCRSDEDRGLEYLLGCLAAHKWMEEANSCLHFLDVRLPAGEKRVAHFFELVLQFFIRTGRELIGLCDPVKKRRYMQTAVCLQILCASSKNFIELAVSLGNVCYELGLLNKNEGLSTNAELFLNVVNAGFSNGNIFSDLSSSLEVSNLEKSLLGPSGGQDWEQGGQKLLPAGYDSFINGIISNNPQGGDYMANSLYVCISHIAMHLQKYSLASEMCRAIPGQGEGAEKEVSLTWCSHYCFVLLREGRFSEAFEKLEDLIEKARSQKVPIAFASAARGLALYYFIHNDIEKAYRVLEKETLYAINSGIAHGHFLDPLVLDMLLVFEQRGLPPIPRYDIHGAIRHIMESSNLLLQGAAQRVQAMLMRSEGAKPWHVAELLQASLERLHPERDRREITLNMHELANTLSMTGEYERAWNIRKEVAQRLGCMLDSTTPYRVAALLATNLVDGVADVLAHVEERLNASKYARGGGATPKKMLRTPSIALSAPRKELNQVVGVSARRLIADLRRVAPTDAYILVHGETGVGKEVTARQIHNMSGRSGAFVCVNPASISESLFESEFFGHERGSFTGAVGQRKGFVELADQGTLFIDEVGDMPLSNQAKLLRVLQEQEFIRVGGNVPIRSDFRLITATNKDLIHEVRRGRFRQDLLHRIMVMPIEIPPLRERREDAGQLVDAFMHFFCQRYKRPLVRLTKEQHGVLHNYDWPGNVRELKNTVERMVIEGSFRPELLLFHSLPAPQTRSATPQMPPASHGASFQCAGLPKLGELEKRYLQYVLEQAGGRVRGAGGAAEMLGIKVSTLYGKLKKMA